MLLLVLLDNSRVKVQESDMFRLIYCFIVKRYALANYIKKNYQTLALSKTFISQETK